MLVSLAQGAEDAAEKQFKLDGKAQAYRETLEASHHGPDAGRYQQDRGV